MKWLFPIWKLQGDVSRPNYFSWVYGFIICITLWHLCHELKSLLHGLFNKFLGISVPFMNTSNQYEFYTDCLKVESAIALELVIQILEGKHPWIRRLLFTPAIPPLAQSFITSMRMSQITCWLWWKICLSKEQKMKLK